MMRVKEESWNPSYLSGCVLPTSVLQLSNPLEIKLRSSLFSVSLFSSLFGWFKLATLPLSFFLSPLSSISFTLSESSSTRSFFFPSNVPLYPWLAGSPLEETVTRATLLSCLTRVSVFPLRLFIVPGYFVLFASLSLPMRIRGFASYGLVVNGSFNDTGMFSEITRNMRRDWLH